MSDLKALHRQAMDLAELGEVAKRQGASAEAANLFRRALEFERDAASLLESNLGAEPTRSVLYRSAASLALDFGNVREAERLIAIALAGEPPEGVAQELRDLFEQVNFQRHLEVRGWTLDVDEIQLSIAGKAVGFGIASSDEFVDRVQNFEKLVYRTVERKTGVPYREKGNPRKAIRKDFGVYMSVPRAASFAVSLKIGFTQPQLSLDLGVLDELLGCLELFNNANEQILKERIPEEPYYRNFVGLARQLAPDGDDVNLVGFTSISNGEQRSVALTRPRDVISVVDQSAPEEQPAELVTVRGYLRYAQSLKGKAERIKLEDDHGRTYDIIVPEGMMSDIVKPLWNDEVVVKGFSEGKAIRLEDIVLAD